MIGTACLLAAAAIGAWWYWRAVVRPRHLHGCPLCQERVRDVATHLTAAHHGVGWICRPCGRYVDHDHSEVHWRLWHAGRPSGPEDRTEWKIR